MLVACTAAPVCNEPYMLVGNDCCLDEDANRICDKDEPMEQLSFEEVKQEQVTQKELAPAKLLPVDELIGLMDKNVHSYTYQTPYAKFDGSTWFVKKDIGMVRVDLHDVLTLKPGDFVDLIVYNLTSREATGYCRRNEHVCRDSLEREYDLDFKQYWDETPMDLLKGYAGRKEVSFRKAAEVVDDRTASVIVFDDQGTATTFWVDAYYGVPLRMLREKGRDKRITTWENMAINTIKNEVFHAFNVKPKMGK